MSTNMAAVTCCALLLLTIMPLGAVAGRHLPAGPPASSIQLQTAPQLVPVPAAPLRRQGRGAGAALGGVLGDGTQFQDRSPPPHRKMIPLSNDFKQVKKRVDHNTDSIYGHRLLVGSSPPTCQGKCGTCFPCNPIHISIGSPHGALTQQEYYPEVWRCKCGSRYFMP